MEPCRCLITTYSPFHMVGMCVLCPGGVCCIFFWFYLFFFTTSCARWLAFLATPHTFFVCSFPLFRGRIDICMYSLDLAAWKKLSFCVLTFLCYLLHISSCIWIHNVRWQSSTSVVVHCMNHNIIFHSRLKQPTAAESQFRFSRKTNTQMITSRAA